MLTSKEVIERTGISRATLNNYIASGLLPRPEVLPPGPEHGVAPRIGYFPDDTVERIEIIQRLKREGWSIGRIADYFANPPAPSVPASTEAARGETVSPAGAAGAAPPSARRAGPHPHRESPAITPVAVLVSTLQDASQLWAMLSAQEYFELANEVWTELDGIFRGHGGLPGRHPDEGLVGYFLPRASHSYLWSALAAAHEARDAMQRVSRRWHARKGWDVELFMNAGIDEGQDWIGAIGADDVRVLGEAADRAMQLSRCSRNGAILVTRNLLGKLPPEERRRVAFGVPRGLPEHDARLLLTFARLRDLAAPGLAPGPAADLPVAQLLDLDASHPLSGGAG